MGSSRQNGTRASTSARNTRSFMPFPVYGGLSMTTSTDRVNPPSRTLLKKSSRLCTTRSNPALASRVPASPS